MIVLINKSFAKDTKAIFDRNILNQIAEIIDEVENANLHRVCLKNQHLSFKRKLLMKDIVQKTSDSERSVKSASIAKAEYQI